MTTKQNRIYLTQAGLEGIKKEYQELVEVKRPKIVVRLFEARREGDLSENNEYIQSRQDLNFIDGRIAELKDVISKAVVANGSHKKCQKVGFGCRVTVKNGDGQQQIFHLVGEWEADPGAQKISSESPLGKSLLGGKIGDEVEVEAPAGKIVYTIKQID
jgi:transcription elongation factor GreA